MTVSGVGSKPANLLRLVYREQRRHRPQSDMLASSAESATLQSALQVLVTVPVVVLAELGPPLQVLQDGVSSL